jgi:tetratricopeptide (TPR) repeat protein
MAAQAFRTENYEKAAEYCESIIELAPEDFEAAFNLGVARQKLGAWKEAAEAYQRAVAINPDAKLAYQNLGAVLAESGDLEAARQAFQSALGLDPGLTESAGQLAWLLEKSDEAEEAEKVYEGLAANQQQAGFASFRLGVLRLEKGDYEGSIAALEDCRTMEGAPSEADWYLGRALWLSGDRPRAEAVFDELLKRQPDSLEALRALAAIALEDKNNERALELHERLFELGDRSSEVCYNTGLLNQELGQDEAAIRYYEEAVAQNPDFAEALLNLGHALRKSGRNDEAISRWQRALELKPGLAAGYFTQ